jgi:bacillolysin
MKKLILLIVTVTCASEIFGQVNLFQKIDGENGITKFYVQLDSGAQISFVPENARSFFGLDEKSDLVLMSIDTDQVQIVHYRYYQTYGGIPVENSMYIVHTKAGKLIASGGGIISRFKPGMDLEMGIRLTAKDAITSAMNYVHAETYAWQDDNYEQQIKQVNGQNATYYPDPKIVWYGGSNGINAGILRLAYKVDIFSVKPLDRKFIYVDALNGKILGLLQELEYSDTYGQANTAYSGSQTIHYDLYAAPNNYRLRDIYNGRSIVTQRATGHTDYTMTAGAWNLSPPDQYALDAHFGVESAYNFYLNVFGRNSLDGQGMQIMSYVNDPTLVNNASWNGLTMSFGNLASGGGGMGLVDVTGHELTHGVTKYTSGLVYTAAESGAINESMSDIMGKSIQFYTKPADNSWIIANDNGLNLRDMAHPKQSISTTQPSTYLSTNNYWYTGPVTDTYVHTNSGVGNLMYYLLVTGGAGTNDNGSVYNVTGIGLTKAQQIIYYTEKNLLVYNSTYPNWRTACITAAQNLYGTYCTPVDQVQNAWYAVGVGAAAPPPPPTCGTPYIGNVQPLGSGVVNLVWSTVPGAVSYNIKFVNGTYTKLFSNFVPATNPNSGAGINFSGIPSGTYTISVQANCSSGLTGAWYTFSMPVQTYSVGNKLMTQTETIDSSSTSVNDLTIKGTFKLFPNPASSQVTVYYNSKGAGNVEIDLFNELGAKLVSKKIGTIDGANTYVIYTGKLSSGVYLVKLTDGSSIFIQKLVVQK